MGTVNPCGSNLLVKNRFGRRSLRVWFSQGIKEFDLERRKATEKKISSTMTEFVSPGAPGNQLQFLDPLFELWANPVVREKLEETGRLWWSNSDITVNLWWSLAAVLLGVATLLLFLKSWHSPQTTRWTLLTPCTNLSDGTTMSSRTFWQSVSDCFSLSSTHLHRHSRAIWLMPVTASPKSIVLVSCDCQLKDMMRTR